MLGHGHAGSGGHQRRRRGDVERRHATAAGPRGVHQGEGVAGGHRNHGLAQGPHSPGDLGGIDAAGPEAHEEPRHLDLRCGAVHERIEDTLGLRSPQNPAAGHLLQQRPELRSVSPITGACRHGPLSCVVGAEILSPMRLFGQSCFA